MRQHEQMKDALPHPPAWLLCRLTKIRQGVIASERSERGDLMLPSRTQRRFETHRLHSKGTSSLHSQRFVLRPRNDTPTKIFLWFYLVICQSLF